MANPDLKIIVVGGDGDGYGIGAGLMRVIGLPKNTNEYSDFSKVNNAIHFMGCNIGKDFDPSTPGNQSFARYLADYQSGVTVYASESGTQKRGHS